MFQSAYSHPGQIRPQDLHHLAPDARRPLHLRLRRLVNTRVPAHPAALPVPPRGGSGGTRAVILSCRPCSRSSSSTRGRTQATSWIPARQRRHHARSPGCGWLERLLLKALPCLSACSHGQPGGRTMSSVLRQRQGVMMMMSLKRLDARREGERVHPEAQRQRRQGGESEADG